VALNSVYERVAGLQGFQTTMVVVLQDEAKRSHARALGADLHQMGEQASVPRQ